ncbi:Flp pilus assembly protein CpaB [Novosphingobium sp. FSY-8]|uniref:Flp pilus assembly protein CpaB n=1 Tax=Novosphingobium ovatum TaxID=1908523 RepID=A0ABW9XE51_9SPHN|nr:Flp pilus assembly protein CpaB [Novosphingobium ovatum]NBC36799.1 Flp pilus assembly protein CpaB [Novosphingobium ovatum]
MDKKKLMLLMGAMVIAVGTALAARSMLAGSAAPSVQATIPIVAPKGPKVLVAQRALPPGTIITADAISFQDWPDNMVRDAYFVDGKVNMNKLVGTVVRYPITAGQPLTQGALVAPGDRGFLAAALGPGMRAVTITVSAKSGVAGFIFPGDHVDVMLSQNVKSTGADSQGLNVTETVLRNVRVLATDQSTESESANGKTLVRQFNTVTLEVTPKIAEKIEVAQQVGSLSLTLRALADTPQELDRAIARGDAGGPASAQPAGGATRRSFYMPSEGGGSLTTGGEVSRFQRKNVPPAGPSAAGAFAGLTGAPRPDAGVRVMRGSSSTTVNPNGGAANGNPLASLMGGLMSAAASGAPSGAPVSTAQQ